MRKLPAKKLLNILRKQTRTSFIATDMSCIRIFFPEALVAAIGKSLTLVFLRICE